MQIPSTIFRTSPTAYCCVMLWLCCSVGTTRVHAQFAAEALPPPPGDITSGVRVQESTAQPLTPFAPLQSDMSVRIKDIAFVEGDRVNHVSGEGLVFGLSGTGGKSQQTRQMAANYYLRRGVRVLQVDTKNMSAVMVSGKIPAYARPGETILVTVSVADDASSLRGGTLNQTALRGIDDEIYAIAQGAIIGGGISAEGAAASVQKNHPTVGVCEAIVERAVPCGTIVSNGTLRLILRNKSYSTATAIGNALNRWSIAARRWCRSAPNCPACVWCASAPCPANISMPRRSFCWLRCMRSFWAVMIWCIFTMWRHPTCCRCCACASR